MLQTPIAKITALLAMAVVVWALARGRRPERLAALVIAVDWIGSTVFQDRRSYHHGQPVMFALDVLQALVFLGLTARYRRTWLLWAAACTSLLVFTHLVFSMSQGFGQWAYLTMNYIWSLGLLAAVAVGVGFEGVRPPAILGWSFGCLRAAHPSTPSATVRTRN